MNADESVELVGVDCAPYNKLVSVLVSEAFLFQIMTVSGSGGSMLKKVRQERP